MKIQIIQKQCGGTEFLAQPHRLHLGAQNAAGVDELHFSLPEEWAAMGENGYTAYTRPGSYDCYAILPIDDDAEELPPSLYEQFVARVLESSSSASTPRACSASGMWVASPVDDAV